MIKKAIILITGSFFSGAILTQIYPRTGFGIGVIVFILSYLCYTDEHR